MAIAVIERFKQESIYGPSAGRKYRAKNPRNNFVFVPNRLPNLFARRPDTTRPLPRIEMRIGQHKQCLLEDPFVILSFLDIERMLLLIS